MSKINIDEKLLDFYGYDVPEYVKQVGKSFITIMTGNSWEGDPSPLKIRISDVIRYYAGDARDISSGMRTIAGFSSDWRGIDRLANECLSWFKLVNRGGLEKEGRKYGMELKN